jgi:hypothetical protein
MKWLLLSIYDMQEPTHDKPTHSYSRKARLEDFLDEDEIKTNHKQHYSHNNNNNDTISKNQQEFGHKKRIKP